jgi:hypothetical protein
MKDNLIEYEFLMEDPIPHYWGTTRFQIRKQTQIQPNEIAATYNNSQKLLESIQKERNLYKFMNQKENLNLDFRYLSPYDSVFPIIATLAITSFYCFKTNYNSKKTNLAFLITTFSFLAVSKLLGLSKKPLQHFPTENIKVLCLLDALQAEAPKKKYGI